MPSWSIMLPWLLALLLGVHRSKGELANPLDCRDPDLGGRLPLDLHQKTRKLVLIHGEGAGIGNFLDFFPSAYYFAALTGRDIAIMDKSLIADMCKILYCGFPLESEMTAAYPHLREAMGTMEGGKGNKFVSHFKSTNPEHHLNSWITRADGYKDLQGWYNDLEDSRVLECITNITRCDPGDIHCHDRHALQRLIRGPFKAQLTKEQDERVLGVPRNLKRAIFSLPHAFAPRLDAAFHLRCQFSHFEMSVGSDDGKMWEEFVAERDEWINSTDSNGGQRVFRVMTEKLMREIPMLREKAAIEKKRARKRLLQYIGYLESESKPNSFYSKSIDKGNGQHRSLTRALLDSADDKDEDLMYVYLASDNEAVKEAFASYLLEHTNNTVAVMRIKNTAEIAHAKNAAFFRTVGRGAGPFDLAADWYALSLSNVIFAFRRGTAKISTFAQSAQHMSGNTELTDPKKAIGHGMGSVGLSLYFKMEHKDWWEPVWKWFF